MPEGLSKKEQMKFFNDFKKNIDKYKVDLTAIQSTGLEDKDARLYEMVTFLAKKLSGVSE